METKKKEIGRMSLYKTGKMVPSQSHEVVDEYHLVVQAQQGNDAAFESLYKQYTGRICLYVTRLVGNDAIGCELAQETFIKAWESLRDLQDPSRFAAWLYRIATHKAYNHQHRMKLFAMIPWEEYTRGDEEEPSMAGPEEQVEETELLKAALACVSLTYRPCLILYVIEELPQRHIAERLGIKESCVSKYVSRGKEELRQIYARLTNEHKKVTGGSRDR
jgi:RNA polymerase sigma-70 factor (ECF subfamily)